MKTICLFCVLCCLSCLVPVYAETAPIDEYKVKAGYLFNFTKFIAWPADNTETFNICIVGNDPFGESINPIEQRTAFNRPIKLFRLTAINAESHCHIVYMNADGSVKTPGSGAKNGLTVGENADFITQCGMIAFIKQQDKIKLQINLKLLQQNGLKVSAKLLEVAELVEGCSHD